MSVINIDQNFVDTNPILVSDTSYNLIEDITMSSGFDVSGSDITFNGMNHKITITQSFNGLFDNTINVGSLGVVPLDGTIVLGNNNGWFFQSGIGGAAVNCYSTGNIGENGGGIFGSDVLNAVVLNCYSTGDISINGGGIFGANCGNGGNGGAGGAGGAGDPGGDGGDNGGSNGGAGNAGDNNIIPGGIGGNGGTSTVFIFNCFSTGKNSLESTSNNRRLPSIKSSSAIITLSNFFSKFSPGNSYVQYH